MREAISEIKNYDAVFLNGEKSNQKLSKFLKKLNSEIKIFEAKYSPINLRSFNLNKISIFSSTQKKKEDVSCHDLCILRLVWLF